MLKTTRTFTHMVSSNFTLTKDMLATGAVEVEMRYPVYGDLRKARKLFPFSKAERGEALGYAPEDLMLASMLVSINGAAVDNSVDLVDRLGPLPSADRQALTTIMFESFFLSKERAQLAGTNARERRLDIHAVRDIPATEVPSGTTSMRFNMPTASVQMICEQQYLGMEKTGLGLEEYIFAYCLTHIGAQDISNEKDKVKFLDDLTIEDVQYAVNYFIASSSIDEETRAELKKRAASIKQQLIAQRLQESIVTPKAVTPTLLGSPVVS